VKSFCWHKSVKRRLACRGVARKGVDGRLRSPFSFLSKQLENKQDNLFLILPFLCFTLCTTFCFELICYRKRESKSQFHSPSLKNYPTFRYGVLKNIVQPAQNDTAGGLFAKQDK